MYLKKNHCNKKGHNYKYKKRLHTASQEKAPDSQVISLARPLPHFKPGYLTRLDCCNFKKMYHTLFLLLKITVGKLWQGKPSKRPTVRATVGIGLGHQVGGHVEGVQRNLHLLQLR